jgi:hypothetical protein
MSHTRDSVTTVGVSSAANLRAPHQFSRTSATFYFPGASTHSPPSDMARHGGLVGRAWAGLGGPWRALAGRGWACTEGTFRRGADRAAPSGRGAAIGAVDAIETEEALEHPSSRPVGVFPQEVMTAAGGGKPPE